MEDIAPGDFKTSVTTNTDNKVDTKPLRNFGMFEINIHDGQGQELIAKDVSLTFSQLQ